MAAQQDWEIDRQRFVSRLSNKAVGATAGVADDRSGLWSPLARQFADIGRDLYTPTNLADVLQRVVTRTEKIVSGCGIVGITLRSGEGPLVTACSTQDAVVLIDELQHALGEGPFFDVVGPESTGTVSSADLADETEWPDFGPEAADLGIRSVLAVGLFPFDGYRTGSLSVYSTEPRGLAAADPDVVLVLAAFAAAALGDNTAVRADELRGMALAGLFPSDRAMTCAADFLMNRRHLSAEESYDILRRASAELVLARHSGG